MNPILRLRVQTGVTQKTLARMAGTSQPTIASYEAGKKSPTLETLERLAKSLGLEATVAFVPPLTREDLRSLAYHRAVVEKLKREPSVVLARARRNLRSMSASNPDAKRLFDHWKEALNSPLDDLIAYCLDFGLLSRDMRQVTPFSGILTAKERLEVIKRFRKAEGR